MSGIAHYIQQVCAEAAIPLQQLHAVAVSAGPGSYTGLRIGTSIAKGICQAGNIPLLAINTLEAMISGAALKLGDPDAYFCPLIDARRMEVYTMLGDAKGKTTVAPFAYVVEQPAFDWIPQDKLCYCFGSGAAKCAEHLPANCKVASDYAITAEHLHRLAFQQFSAGKFADLAYFEPEYLKEFYTPVKKQ